MSGPVRDFVGYGPNPPAVQWPGGAQLAVNLVVNYEEGAEYSIPDDGVNDSWGEYTFQYGPETRDLGTEMHFEYGSRAGIWRLCRLFDQFKIPVTFAACALALERNPPLCEWLRARDHDFLGHGYRWYGPDNTIGANMSREAEREEIRRAVASIQKTTGQRLRGWMVRSFPTLHTRELLLEEGGFLYDSDSTNDELPYYVTVLGKPFLIVPYTKVYNDTRYLIHPTYATPRHFFETLKGGLDYMLEEARRSGAGRMMSVGIHPRWSGQATRTAALRDFIAYALKQEGVRFMCRQDIATHWAATVKPGATERER
ncbi:MAG: polysaccharide deacetylase family protein [Candidatus Dormibacteraeota bacterium]|nr:polysaccharide deacetylase family protein [Candidatus Dormibacteraeota bacterium]